MREAWALRLLGEIAAQSERPQIEEADEYYGQALALAQELGMRPLRLTSSLWRRSRRLRET